MSAKKRKRPNLSDEERQRRSDFMKNLAAKRRQTAQDVAALSPSEAQRELNDARSQRVDNLSTEGSALSVEASVAVLERPEIPTDPNPVLEQRPPEVQAVIDSMTPERRARLAMHQSQVLQTKDGQAALARHEAEKAVGMTPSPAAQGVASLQEREASNLPPTRIGSRELSIIVRTDGTMVSQYGPCLCGKAKREWHTICLKENPNGQHI